MEALVPLVTGIFELGVETSREHCYSFGIKFQVEHEPSNYDILLDDTEDVLNRVSDVDGLYPIFMKFIEEYIKSNNWKKRYILTKI